jgi:hypothetical protein
MSPVVRSKFWFSVPILAECSLKGLLCGTDIFDPNAGLYGQGVEYLSICELGLKRDLF